MLIFVLIDNNIQCNKGSSANNKAKIGFNSQILAV